ncbi:hypothetical protein METBISCDRAFT_22569 [Metschnikowia bicuspidata]|uniref:Arrestin C-terminal-like domain-containing protein n=1 Tax=Metschnikowia bicuspidata TaxID=27322 RepID=A0A4P9ZE58_9ASCO|nr:hypothetical protein METBISCDRAFT_22569 [Metschnikowia bicuspidata]
MYRNVRQARTELPSPDEESEDSSGHERSFISIPRQGVDGNYSLPFSISLPSNIPEYVESLDGDFSNTWPGKLDFQVSITRLAVAIGTTVPIKVVIVPLIKGVSFHSLKDFEYEDIIARQRLTCNEPFFGEHLWRIQGSFHVPYTLSTVTQTCQIKNDIINVKHAFRVIAHIKNADDLLVDHTSCHSPLEQLRQSGSNVLLLPMETHELLYSLKASLALGLEQLLAITCYQDALEGNSDDNGEVPAASYVTGDILHTSPTSTSSLVKPDECQKCQYTDVLFPREKVIAAKKNHFHI